MPRLQTREKFFDGLSTLDNSLLTFPISCYNTGQTDLYRKLFQSTVASLQLSKKADYAYDGRVKVAMTFLQITIALVSLSLLQLCTS